jgi:hypothetical protein
VRFTSDVAEAGALLELDVLDRVTVGHDGARISQRERGRS